MRCMYRAWQIDFCLTKWMHVQNSLQSASTSVGAPWTRSFLCCSSSSSVASGFFGTCLDIQPWSCMKLAVQRMTQRYIWNSHIILQWHSKSYESKHPPCMPSYAHIILDSTSALEAYHTPYQHMEQVTGSVSKSWLFETADPSSCWDSSAGLGNGEANGALPWGTWLGEIRAMADKYVQSWKTLLVIQSL